MEMLIINFEVYQISPLRESWAQSVKMILRAAQSGRADTLMTITQQQRSSQGLPAQMQAWSGQVKSLVSAD